jgi:hypothetical protein
MRARVVGLLAASFLWMGCEGEGSVEGDADASIGFGDAQPQDGAGPDDGGGPTAPGTVLFTLPVMRTAYTNGHMMFQLVVEGGEADAVELYVDGSLLVRLIEPYTYTWDTRGTPQGEYEIEARAWRDGEVVSTDHRTLVVDRTPPTLQWHAPSDGEEGVRLSDPIVLSFSEPIDPPTVNTGSIMVFSEGRRLPRSVALSPEGDTVSVRLSSGLPAFPADVTVRVDSGVSDRAGNPLANDVEFTFNMPEWVESADLGGVPGLHQPLQIASGPDGTLWLLFVEQEEPTLTATNTLRVARRVDGVWEVLPGSPWRDLYGRSGGAQIAIAPDGAPVVAFLTGSTDEQPFVTAVSRYDGAAWVGLDDAGRPDYWSETTHQRELRVAPNGQVYLATRTADAGVRVARHDASGWTVLGSGWADATYVALLVDDDEPVVAVSPSSEVYRWDGTAWADEDRAMTSCSQFRVAKAPQGLVGFCSSGSGTTPRCNVLASWSVDPWSSNWEWIAQVNGHCRAAFSEPDGYTLVTTTRVYSSTSGTATVGDYPPNFVSATNTPGAPQVHVSSAQSGHRIVRPNWLLGIDPVFEDPGPISDPSCDCDDGFECTDDLCIDGECVHSPVHTRCAPGDYCAVGAGCTTGGSCRAPEDCGQPAPCVYGACVSGRCVYSIFDADGDGRPPPSCGGMDCDDLDPTVFPGAPEICNGLDNDCDGVPDSPNADAFCGSGFQCIGGTCGCPATRIECRDGNTDICVDPLGNHNHCGACDNRCNQTRECVAGSCECREGLTSCGDAWCHNLLTNPNHCGECGNRCATGASCVEGDCQCDGADEVVCPGADGMFGPGPGYCADLGTAPDDCGECGFQCLRASECHDGQCGVVGDWWVAYVGNTEWESVALDPGLAVDPDGHLILTADARSTFYHHSASADPENLDSFGHHLVKATSLGAPVWTQRLWANTGSPARVITDADGDIYVVGRFRGTSTTIDGTTITGSSNTWRLTGLILKLSGDDGSLLWHQVFPARDISPVASADATDVAIDADGNLVVVGALPVLWDLGGGDLDPAEGTGVVYRFAPDGSHLASWRIDDAPQHVGFAPNGDLAVASHATAYRYDPAGDLLDAFTAPQTIHTMAPIDGGILLSLGNLTIARYAWDGTQVWPATAPASGSKLTHRIILTDAGIYLSGGAASSYDILGTTLSGWTSASGFVARVSPGGEYEAGGTFYTNRNISGGSAATGLVVLEGGEVVFAAKGSSTMVLRGATGPSSVFGTGTYVGQVQFAP